MIPTLILMLIRYYRKVNPQQFFAWKMRLFYAARVILFIALYFVIALVAYSQEVKSLVYTVKKGSNRIGSMSVKEFRTGNTISLKLQSTIRTGFIFSFTASGLEEATYNDGVLVYSSVYQKLNGNERINKRMKFVNDTYLISNNGKEEKLSNIKIYYNLLRIYSHEPLTTAFIFSDKYQKFLPVQKIEPHHYKIKFPDGSTNEYWFEKGVCKRVEIDHTLYSAIMELNQ